MYSATGDERGLYTASDSFCRLDKGFIKLKMKMSARKSPVGRTMEVFSGKGSHGMEDVTESTLLS